MKQQKKIFVLAGFAHSLLNFRGPLLSEMVARGHAVIAAAPADKHTEEVARTLLKMGVHFVAVPMARTGMNPWQDLKGFRTLVQLFRAYQPDVVLGYTAKPIIYGGMAVRKVGGIKFYPMITGLGYAFTESRGFKRKAVRALMQRLYRRGLAAADAVIFQNPDDQGLFRALKLLPDNTFTAQVNGSGVDLATFPPMPLADRPVFLMLARLVEDKGVREYVAAARQVKQLHPEAMFRLAGGLDPNPASIKLAELQAWADEGVIEYLGNIQPVQTALSTCRFFVLPSYREGTPRSVLEALATGRPVITADTPGCRETVVHGKNGLLVPPRDADSLASAMVKLIKMPEADVQRMADISFALARDKYDVQKVNAEVLRVMGL